MSAEYRVKTTILLLLILYLTYTITPLTATATSTHTIGTLDGRVLKISIPATELGFLKNAKTGSLAVMIYDGRR